MNNPLHRLAPAGSALGRPWRFALVLVLLILAAGIDVLAGGPGTGGVGRQPGWTGAYYRAYPVPDGGEAFHFSVSDPYEGGPPIVIDRAGDTYFAVLVGDEARYSLPPGTYSDEIGGCGVALQFDPTTSFTVWPGFHADIDNVGVVYPAGHCGLSV